MESDPTAAASDLAAAVNMIEGKGLGLHSAHVGYAEGLLSFRSGQLDSADRALTKAQEEAMSRGQRLRLVEILSTRASVAATMGEGDVAMAHSEAAKSVIDAIASGIADETLRDGFLERWDVFAAENIPADWRGFRSED